ncbi:MAG: hypothetical protein MRY81_10100 [Donghicola eburneus]|nr:hypothetical protein [Donghicola eburneus]MCI5040024.1 hypothetical protein [Donghicola eburneus]
MRPTIANPAAAMMQGMAYGQQMKDMKRQNALYDLYQQQGAGIASGEPNALNALAQYDPMAAREVQVQNSRLEMDRQQEARLAKKFELEVAQYAQSLDAAAAKAEAEQIRQGLFAAASAQTPEQWDALANQFGVPDLVGQFENREAYLNRYSTAADILEQQAGPKPQSAPGKVQADIQAGILPPDTPLRGNADSMSITTPDGLVIRQGGAAAPPPKMTVDAAKNSGFLIRMSEANQTLNELEDQGTQFFQQNLEHIPFGAGNYLRSPEFQRFDQARRDFVNAILRRESGAVISDQEFDNADKQYFPVPGDSAEVIAQKRRNRETAVQGIRLGSGPGAPYVDQLRQSEAQKPETAEPPKETVLPEVPNFTEMSDEELDAYIEKLGGE